MRFSEALVIALKQKELYQYLLHKNNYDNEYADPASIQWVKEQVAKYFEIAGNNGKVVDWILAMEKWLELEQIEQFMKWFRMKQQSLPVEDRDIFKWDATAVNSILDNQNMDEQAQNAVSEIYNQGGYSIIKADTPEAIVAVANCDGRTANNWCIKGFAHAKSYGPPAYFIKKNGQNYIAVLPNSSEIRDLKDEAVSDPAVLNEIYPMVSFIIEKEYAGRWPYGGAFVHINRHMDKSLIPTLLDAANSDYNVDNVNAGNGPSTKILNYVRELLYEKINKEGSPDYQSLESLFNEILQKNSNNGPFLERIGGYLNYAFGDRNGLLRSYMNYMDQEKQDLETLKYLYQERADGGLNDAGNNPNLPNTIMKSEQKLQTLENNKKSFLKQVEDFLEKYAIEFYNLAERAGNQNAS